MPEHHSDTADRPGERKGWREANGAGSLWFDHARGRWEYQFTVDGQRRKVTAKLPFSTSPRLLRKVEAHLHERAGSVRAEVEEAKRPKPAWTDETLGGYLDRWLDNTVKPSTRRGTYHSYCAITRLYIEPAIGAVRLVDLTADDVESMLATLANAGYGVETRKLVRAVLRKALADAVRKGLVATNVATMTAPIKGARKRGRSLTPVQARKVVDAIAASPHEALLALMLATGVRKGEALGLRWADIDLDVGTAVIERTLCRAPGSEADGGGLYLATSTKTDQSDRDVALDPGVMAALNRWRAQQSKQRDLVASDQWGARRGRDDRWPADLVFTKSHGQPYDLSDPNEILGDLTEAIGAEYETDPGDPARKRQRIKPGTGLGRWTPHQLRHTAASLMIGAGVPLATVSEVLGHASIRTTKDVYGHLVSGEKQAAARSLGAVLWGDDGERGVPLRVVNGE